MTRTLAHIGFAALCFQAVFAQTAATVPKFAVADIHTSGPNTIPEMRARFTGGRYELRNATMVDLIRTAWSVDADKVVGGPDWLDTDRFDVIASAAPSASQETLNAMLRQLLVDRFHLVARTETRGLPAYAITVDRKPDLKPADGNQDAGCEIQQSKLPQPPGVVFACRNITMAAFAKALSGVREASGYLFNYPVVDRTGLEGARTFSVEWFPRVALRPTSVPPDAITIFNAFEKQLGLKLNLIKVPTPVVVVESANEKPTGNPPEVTANPPAPLEFEVADIKPDAEYREGSYVSIQPGGRVRINMTVKGLIAEAWGDMNPDRIMGGPKSLNATRFVVIAKAPFQENAVAGWNGPVWNGLDVDSMRMMLRALLVDRFKLAAHIEDRLISGYEMVSRKPKLRKADPSNRPGCREGPGADGKDPRLENPLASRLITCRNMTLTQYAAELNKLFVELPPIVNSTRIPGRYDFTINFSPSSLVTSEPNGAISFTEALSGQLGLKLKSTRVMAPVLVIDHVNDTPTEN